VDYSDDVNKTQEFVPAQIEFIATCCIVATAENAHIGNLGPSCYSFSHRRYAGGRRDRIATKLNIEKMNSFQDAAYTMAAVSATVALFRALIKKGVLTREEASRVILDEAVARAIQAEAQQQGHGVGRSNMDLNRQSAEILKFIAEKL
jgi:hypothetical protein